MTSKKMNGKINSDCYPQPFLLEPAFKSHLWGGTRLRDNFSKESHREIVAETWECSTHPDGPSLVASGAFRGQTLRRVLQSHPQWAGGPCPDGQLPVLLKLIDAKEDLSVQVHPDNQYARVHENGALGKTEMWYILDAAEGAAIVYGFLHPVTPQQIRQSVEQGCLQQHLRRIPVKKGDVFFIPAGMVHAVGAGILLAEIQQNSNITYRLYDYERRDENGFTRPLQLDQALAVARLSPSEPPCRLKGIIRFERGATLHPLCRCSYFQVEYLRLDTRRRHQFWYLNSTPHSFQILQCIQGCGSVFWEGKSLFFHRGDCIFVPAGTAKLGFHGQGELLKIQC